jgi:ribokinase
MSIGVLGSYVNANCLQVQRLPMCGESMLAEQWWAEVGGKGLNLAVGMHRLGLVTHTLLAIGQDAAGDHLLAFLQAEGMDATGVIRTAQPSGFGVGLVTPAGQNLIVVYEGANAALNAQHVQHWFDDVACAESQLVCAQFEIPDQPIVTAFRLARQQGVTTLLNPSPWRVLNAELFALTDILVVNETEAMGLLRLEASAPLTPVQWCEQLEQFAEQARISGIWQGQLLVVTLAEQGCVALARGQCAVHAPAWSIIQQEPTGAGDAFAAGLAYAWVNAWSLAETLRFANACGAIVAASHGVLTALPSQQAVATFMATAISPACPVLTHL